MSLDEGDQPPPYSSLLAPPQIPSRLSQQQQQRGQDPRASSTTSLGIVGDGQYGSRNLLLVYIHGFMGSETSFQGFPAHVHNMVSPVLSQTHIVHTKVYPRYRSKKSIQAAANDFGTWLAPHENANTDVILLGHSMGGLLLGEMVLLPDPDDGGLRHRVLGTISFDTPFLGMHPSIITSGLGSLFSPSPLPDDKEPITEFMPSDPNFNPTFFNDNHLPVRTAWRNAAHFVNKHSNALFTATKQAVASHIEFGSCLADYDALNIRYCRLRMLEEEDPARRKTVLWGSTGPPPRVRFSNFYTASTGRQKKDKAPANDASTTTATAPTPTSVYDSATPRTPSLSTSQSDILMHTPLKPEKGEIRQVHPDDGDGSTLSDVTDLDSLHDLESNFDETHSNYEGFTPAVPHYSSVPHRPDIVTQTSPIAEKASTAVLAQTTPTIDEPPSQARFPMATPFGKPAPPMQNSMQQYTDQVLKAYEDEQASMAPEPTHPDPPPSVEDFEDGLDYRAALSDHGRASQAYYNESKDHQKAQYDMFMASTKQKMEDYRAEIKRLSGLIGEESTRMAAGVAENARIVAEINRESSLARAEHMRLVSDYQIRVGQQKATSSARAAEDAVSKAQRRVNKTQQRLQERQAKLDQRMEKHQRRLEKKLGKAMKAHGSPYTSAQSWETGGAAHTNDDASDRMTLFDAMEDMPGAKDGSYDLGSAPIADAIAPLPSSHSSRKSIDALTKQKTSSQLTLESAYGTRGAALSPPASSTDTASLAKHLEPKKTPKDRMFCTLPPADSSGNRDPTWVRVPMQDMDQVAAHTGLFFASSSLEPAPAGQEWSERYSKFVCDVAEKIEVWVGEEMTRRLVEGWEGEP